MTPTSFAEWMYYVDAHLAAALGGLTSDDLPDQTYADWYEDGITPAQAARLALANEGMADD